MSQKKLYLTLSDEGCLIELYILASNFKWRGGMNSYSLILGNIGANTTIITPNQRLAQFLQQSYNAENAAKQRTWESLDVLPINRWLVRQFHALAAHSLQPLPTLLSAIQSKVIWQQIISSTQPSNLLITETMLCNLALQAWQLLQQWQISLFELENYDSLETATFYQWATHFKAIYSEKHYLEETQLAHYLCQSKLLRNISPKQLILFGFEEITPHLAALCQHYQQQGTEIITQHLPEAINNQCHYMAHLTTELEIASVVTCAYQLHQQNPELRIGCITPNLTQTRTLFLQMFRDLIRPNELFAPTVQHNLPIDISMGLPLTDYPMIQHALASLQWLNNAWDCLTLSTLLTSPWLGDSETEKTQRLQLDTKLRDYPMTQCPAHFVLNLLEAHCPLLAFRIVKARELKIQQALSPTEWANLWIALWQKLGFPGSQQLDSLSYQLHLQLNQLLVQFCDLTLVLPSCDFSTAQHHLQQLAASTIFQPEQPKANIQILGLLEGAGLPFDHLFVTGLHLEAWPESPKPHPLLPYDLQQKYQLPHATAARERQFAEKITARFAKSAAHVIFSYPKTNSQQITEPSPLILAFPQISTQEIISSPLQTYNLQDYQAQKLISYPKLRGRPYEKELLPGGTSLLHHQAACPFRAYALFRLKAIGLSPRRISPDARSRGQILHDCLASLWQTLKTKQNLQTYTLAKRSQLVTQHLKQTFAHWQKKNPYLISSLWQQVELERAHPLLMRWLEQELERTDFTVEHCEISTEILIGDRRLKIKIDRIDRLPEGTTVVIDYKSGQLPSWQQWFDSRPQDLQLPLYSLAYPDASGISFASLHASLLALDGISAKPLNIDGIRAWETLQHVTKANTWVEQQTQWQQIIADLTTEFVQGEARIAPYQGDSTCQYCELHSLCRINSTKDKNAVE